MKREEVLQRTNLPASGLQVLADELEKRQHPRLPVSLGVEIVDVQTRVRIMGRATDFGVGGCYVDTMNTFAKGTAVEVSLHWEGRTLHLNALVSYAVNDRGIGMGLAFTGTSAEEGANLLDWVTGPGGNPPESAQAPEPESRMSAEPRLARAHRLEEILDDLVALLVRKRVLSETEGAEIRDRISG